MDDHDDEYGQGVLRNKESDEKWGPKNHTLGTNWIKNTRCKMSSSLNQSGKALARNVSYHESAIIGDVRKRGPHTSNIHSICHGWINSARIGMFCLVQLLATESRFKNSKTYLVQAFNLAEGYRPGGIWSEMEWTWLFYTRQPLQSSTDSHVGSLTQLAGSVSF